MKSCYMSWLEDPKQLTLENNMTNTCFDIVSQESAHHQLWAGRAEMSRDIERRRFSDITHVALLFLIPGSLCLPRATIQKVWTSVLIERHVRLAL